jgi:membrane-associated protease RseP (regulator of RpoE activity)
MFTFSWDLDTVGMLAMAALLTVLVFRMPQRFERGLLFPLLGIAMYRSQLGIRTMGWCARLGGRLLDGLGWLIAVLVVPGMVLATGFVLYGIVKVVMGLIPQGQVAGFILPVKNVPGVAYMPLAYYLLTLCVAMVVHEFGHGLFCRRYGVTVKHTGVIIAGGAIFGIIFRNPALLLVIPGGAFVEPDEKEVEALPLQKKLAMLGAGVVINGLCALAFYLLDTQAMTPWLRSMQEPAGIEVTLAENGPAVQAGLRDGDVITAIDGKQVLSGDALVAALKGRKPGETIQVVTLAGAKVPVRLERMQGDAEQGWLGISTGKLHLAAKPGYEAGAGATVRAAVRWTAQLVFLLWAFNLLIGIANLVPFRLFGLAADGHQILTVVLQSRLGKERALRIARIVGLALFSIMLYMMLRSCFPSR